MPGAMTGIPNRWSAGLFALEFGFALLAISFPGCTAPQRSYQPSVDQVKLNDVSFLHYLADLPVVTVDEGMRAVLMLDGVSGQTLSFDEQMASLSRSGTMKAAWKLRSGQILDKGTLAFMLRTLCRLPRGLNERLAALTGLGDRRYALKTCIDEGLMPHGLAYEPVTGGELLTAIITTEKRLDRDASNQP